MIKKLKRVEVEEKLKSLGLTVFTPQEFRDIFDVAQGTASVFISHNLESGGIFSVTTHLTLLVNATHPSPLS